MSFTAETAYVLNNGVCKLTNEYTEYLKRTGGSIKPPNLPEGATNIEHLFAGITGVEEFDLVDMDFSRVTRATFLFAECTDLRKVTMGDKDTSQVTHMSGMFFNCCKLEAADLSGADTSSLVDAVFLFSGCSKLKWVDMSSFPDKRVVDHAFMFEGCVSIQDISCPVKYTTIRRNRYPEQLQPVKHEKIPELIRLQEFRKAIGGN